MRGKCDEFDRQNQEQGAVYKCLISNYEDLPNGCQKVGLPVLVHLNRNSVGCLLV